MSQLKPKLTLQTKGEHTAVAIKQLQVILRWRAAVDLDLMAFYKATDGRVGGVFSDNYPGGSLGSLSQFPFIELSGDSGVEAKDEDHQEVLVIDRLDDLSEVYICTLNYTDAANKRDSSFADYDGEVIVSDNNGRSVTVPLNASQRGQVAVIARIDHDASGNAILKNENLVLGLGQFFSTIPGAKLLSSDPRAATSTTQSPAQSSSPSPKAEDKTQVIMRWIEGIKLRAYDNPYLDKASEKELLREVIAQGLSFEDARAQLVRICESERYALASRLEEQATQVLEPCVAKQGIDRESFDKAVSLVQQSAYGHLKEADCRQMVKKLVLDHQWPVRQGFLKGGNWFKDL